MARGGSACCGWCSPARYRSIRESPPSSPSRGNPTNSGTSTRSAFLYWTAVIERSKRRGTSCRYSALRELEVRYVRGSDRAYELEPVQVVADAGEKPLTGAKKRRHEADLHLVD